MVIVSKLDSVFKPIWHKKSGKKKPIHRQMSMRWHIFGCFLGFCGFLLILLWLFQIIYLDAFYQRIKTNQIEQVASTIVDNIDNGEIEDLLTGLAQTNDLCISMAKVNLEGQFLAGSKLLYQVDMLSNCIIHHMPAEDYLRFYALAVNAGGSYMQIFSRHLFTNKSYSADQFIGWIPGRDKGLSASLIFARVSTNADGDTILILLNSNISPVDATRDTLRIQLIYITGIVIIVSLLLSLLIAKYLASPIIKINTSAAKLAQGDFSGGFEDGGYQEISELSDTLNYAAAELSRTEILQKELIANISHDLRTPLTMIGGYAEAMR
ncbi:MAG: histidine kinase dimerization/phospho-acceptor domain-containing protein, partial [Clostridiales bacterium]